jgi:hypothetical protein
MHALSSVDCDNHFTVQKHIQLFYALNVYNFIDQLDLREAGVKIGRLSYQQ